MIAARATIAIALTLLACKAKIGDACSSREITCEDRGAALACVGGKVARVTCGGRAGCSGACDQSVARAGDPCIGGEACASDAIERLRCEDGRFVSAGRCGGPAGCVVASGAIACDTSRGDVGDPCREPDAVSCARDGKAALVCTGGRLAAKTTCRGPRGCAIENGKLACDDTIAEADDACDLEGQAACSVDGAAELRCVRGKFSRARVCRKPCKANDAEVLCD